MPSREVILAWCRKARELLALAAERAKLLHQQMVVQQRAELSDALHQALLGWDLGTHGAVRTADLLAQSAAAEGEYLQALRHLADLRIALQAHRRLSDALPQAEAALSSLDAVPAIPVHAKQALGERLVSAKKGVNGADHSVAVKLLEEVVRDCAGLTELASRYAETLQRAEAEVAALKRPVLAALASGFRKRIGAAKAEAAKVEWQSAMQSLGEVLSGCAQARKTSQQDDEFQLRWAAIKPQYDAVRRRPAADLDKEDAARLEVAHQRCLNACRKLDFTAALDGLDALQKAIAPLVLDDQQALQRLHDYQGERQRIDGEFHATEYAALRLSSIGGGFEATLSGKLVADIMRLIAVLDEHQNSAAYGTAIQLLPEFESTLKAAAEPLAEVFAEAEQCLDVWAGLKDDYGRATRTPRAADIVPDLVRMKQLRETLGNELAKQNFGASSLKQMQEELLPLLAKVNQRRTELEAQRKTYLDDYGLTVRDRLLEARALRDKLAVLPPGFEAHMIEAEAAYKAVEDCVERFDYPDAQVELISLQYLLDGPIAKCLQALKEERDACQKRFEQDSGREKGSVVGAGAPKDLRQLVKKRLSLVIAYRRAFDAGNYSDADALIEEMATLADEIADRAEYSEDGAAESRSALAVSAVEDYVRQGLLAMRPQAEKVQLLQELLVQNKALDEAALKVQSELYRSIDMDDAFAAADEDRRKQVVASLMSDPEVVPRLKAAKAGWAAQERLPEPLAKVKEKIAVLQKIHDKHCASLGIPSILVEPVEVAPESTGGYSAAKEFIAVNMQSVDVQQDFQASMDLILHETTHWYQANLVQRYLQGDLDENDSEYAQVVLFALNDAGLRADAYVKATDWGSEASAEHNQAYLKQPVEAHAYAAGTGMAKLLMEALDA